MGYGVERAMGAEGAEEDGGILLQEELNPGYYKQISESSQNEMIYIRLVR